MPPLTTPPAITVRGLTKSFGDRVVLDGFDLDVYAGEVVSILGANGSGKSTMLRCLSGLTKFDSGTVTVGGREVRSGEHVPEFAMVFQKIYLVLQLSVLENVCAGALGRLSFWQAWVPRSFPVGVREEAMGCLDRVGLATRAHDRASRLSGGQQQRVAVGRALCQRASVLLADEPVSALDPAAAEQVMRLLRSLAVDGMAVITVLHQPDLARRHSDRIVGLTNGRITLDSARTPLTDAEIDALYAPDYLAEGDFSTSVRAQSQRSLRDDSDPDWGLV
jgi:phosphonate transport system ATP-binding protein